MNNYLLHNYTPESNKSWKSAYEIQAAALEHEKWRYHQIDAQPKSDFQNILRIPLYLLSLLFG